MQLITAPLNDPICLFMVGIQCKSWRSMWKVPSVGRKMMQMQQDLKNDPDSGLIWGTNFNSFAPFTTLYLSYWKSSDHINRFVTDNKFSHKSETQKYWKRFGRDPDIGVWHEAYEIDPLRTENLYFGMTPFGASAFAEIVKIDATNRTFLQRLRREPG